MRFRTVSLFLISVGVLVFSALTFSPKAVLIPNEVQQSRVNSIEDESLREAYVESRAHWTSRHSARAEAKSLKAGVDIGDADSLCRMASLMMYCGRLGADEVRARSLPDRMLNGSFSAGRNKDLLAERRAYCADMDGGIASAFEMFRKSAVAGNHHAQTVFLSGVLFLDSFDGVEALGEQYLRSAKEILRISVEDGNRDVIFMLADAYAGRPESRALGLIVTPNPAASRHINQMLLDELDGSVDPEAEISRMTLRGRLRDMDSDDVGQLSDASLDDYAPRLKAGSSVLDVSHISNPVGRIVGECR
ncbi:hypothetical protein [Stenotrophomonas indicatrix]